MSANEIQIGGSHCKDMPIQPAEFIIKNQLAGAEAAVIEYVCRHRQKGGADDIRKAIHWLELLLQWEYGNAELEHWQQILEFHEPDPPDTEGIRVTEHRKPGRTCPELKRRTDGAKRMSQQPDTKPGFYYVSVVRDDGNYRLLRGPFVNDHGTALAAVDEAREKACELDPRGHWYAYGTCRTDENHGPGILDRQVA